MAITSIDDLRGTSWIINETIERSALNISAGLKATNGTIKNIATYSYNENIFIVDATTTENAISLGLGLSYEYFILRNLNNEIKLYDYTLSIESEFAGLPRRLTFGTWEDGALTSYDAIVEKDTFKDFLTMLKIYGTLEGEEPKTTVRVNGKVLNQINGKKVRAIHYGDKTWEL